MVEEATLSHEVKIRSVEWSAKCQCGNGWENYRDKGKLEKSIKEHQILNGEKVNAP